MTRSPKVSRAPVTRNAPAGSTATLWNVGRVPAGTSIVWPDGQRPAAGPALVKIRPSVSMTARTSAGVCVASLAASPVTVARSCSSDDPLKRRSVKYVSSAALSVGFSARVAIAATWSCWRLVSSAVKTFSLTFSLSVSAARTRSRTSRVMTMKTTVRMTATVIKVTISVRATRRGGVFTAALEREGRSQSLPDGQDRPAAAGWCRRAVHATR